MSHSLPAAKIDHFAGEAGALDASEMGDFAVVKRIVLEVCLLHRARVQARDDLVTMLCKRMNTLHNKAGELLEEIRAEQRERNERMLAVFGEVLPALLAVFGRVAFWPSKTKAGTGKAGLWGRVATRVVRRPAVPLTIGVLVFGALAIGVWSYQPGGFGGSINAPAGTDSAAGTALLAKHFPSSSANPTNLVYKLSQPVWENPGLVAAATASSPRAACSPASPGR